MVALEEMEVSQNNGQSGICPHLFYISTRVYYSVQNIESHHLSRAFDDSMLVAEFLFFISQKNWD